MDDNQTTQVAVTADGGTPPDAQGGTGALGQLGWKTELPASLREHEAFAPYQDKNALWDGHIKAVNRLKDLEATLANSIPKPGENASPEEMASYYNALGRPESPDQYKFETPTLPEGLTVDPTLETWFKQAAFETGLNAGQASAIYKQYMDLVTQTHTAGVEARNKARAEAETKLYTEWGDKKAENVAMVKKAMGQFGDASLVKYFDETGAGNDPAMISFFLKVGLAMSDDTLARGNMGDVPTPKTDPNTGLPVFEYPTMQSQSGG